MSLYIETDRLGSSSLSKCKANLYFKAFIILKNKDACSGLIELIAVTLTLKFYFKFAI